MSYRERLKHWASIVRRRLRTRRRRVREVQHLRRLEADRRRYVIQRRRAAIASRGKPWAAEKAQAYVDAQVALDDVRARLHVEEENLLYTTRELNAARATLQKLHSEATGNLQQRAWKIAGDLVGVMEHGGNNTGPMVDRIIRENNGPIGEPWCGDFAAYVYRHAGAHDVVRQWASAWGIEDAAGVHITGNPIEGDLVNYKFQHIGLYGFGHGSGTIRTREGNTGASGAVSDSSTGGDGVYEKVRSESLVRHYLHVNG